MARGTLRIFLGAAPGVGKTYEMLEEAHRLGTRGEDVVVAFALDHGRAETRALLEGLEIIPPRRLPYRGTDFEEMDLDAVLHRAPATAIVDEYAHSNIPGSRHAKRWEDIDELLAAGINVLSTVNIQHLASLGDVVSAVTEVRQAETVPDDVVRRADQIHLVDISPELLRQRLSDGKIYAPDKIDAALSNYFRLGNLTALRELALLWLADRVDEGLARYRADNDIQATWPARERIVIGLTGGPEGEILIRRGARILNRVSGGDLLAVHVRAADGVGRANPAGTRSPAPPDPGPRRQLSHRCRRRPRHAPAGLRPQRQRHPVVVGISRRGKLAGLLGALSAAASAPGWSGTPATSTSTWSPIPSGEAAPDPAGNGISAGSGSPPASSSPSCCPFCSSCCLPLNPDQNVATAVLVQLAGSVTVALVGGLWPAILAALWSSLLVNYFSTPPVGTLTINDPQNVLALLVFVGVSAAVAVVVDRLSPPLQGGRPGPRRSHHPLRPHPRRGQRRGHRPGPAGTGTCRLQCPWRGPLQPRPNTPATADAAGKPGTHRPCRRAPGAGTHGAKPASRLPQRKYRTDRRGHPAGPFRPGPAGQRPAAAGRVRRPPGRPAGTPATDRQPPRILRLAEGNTMRTSILRAVSHDLRTPLAGIKLAVGSLRQTDVHYTAEERAGTAADHRRMRGPAGPARREPPGHVPDHRGLRQPLLRPVCWADVIPAALRGIPAGRVRVVLPATCPKSTRTPGCWSGSSPTSSKTPSSTPRIRHRHRRSGRRTQQRKNRRPARRRTAHHRSRPGHPRRKVVRMFRPFQRPTTSRRPPASAWAWPSRKDSPKPWAGH